MRTMRGWVVALLATLCASAILAERVVALGC
jgi:hypothetical protein